MPNHLANFKRIFIFDPCFGEMTGHWENYCVRLYQELIARGCEVKVYGQKKFDPAITNGIRFVPTFEFTPFGNFTDIYDYYHRVNLFVENFKKIDEADFQDGDLFIFHSIFPHTFAAILEWTEDLLARKKITSSFFFQLPPSESKGYSSSLLRKLYHSAKSMLPKNRKNRSLVWLDSNNVRFYQLSSERINKLIENGSHILLASTQLLKQNFSMMLSAPVHYLPMPGPKTYYPQPDHKEQGIVKVGYFGHSSSAKGGQFLQYIVEKTLALHSNVKFILHINANHETKDAFEFFKTFDHPRVTCYFGHIDPERMMSLMTQVDIIMMPYAPIKYATTPSAVFTEGMPLQKIFIIPKDTWIHQEAVKHKTGYVSFSKYTQKSVYQALEKAIDNYEQLAEKSYIGGKSFYQENNITNYIDVVENIFNKKYITYENII
jgi:hypothetical protein